jgi:hypothetical protein
MNYFKTNLDKSSITHIKNGHNGTYIIDMRT